MTILIKKHCLAPKNEQKTAIKLNIHKKMDLKAD